MSSSADRARCYAVRRVNPFEGVLQIVETPSARAYSPNGHIWQIQVLAQRPDHTWRSFSDVLPIEQFFNFGLWEAESGLHKIPANPVMDIGGMSTAAQALAEELQSLIERLPFRLIDDYECWATDHHGRPVALLATTENPQRMHDLRIGRWQATRLADHGFVSQSLLAQDIPARGDLGPRQHAEQLERQVRKLGQHKRWFRRRRDGSRERLDPGDESARAANDAFPVLGLTADWRDEQARQLAMDYLAWQAPWLLLLQEIADEQRRWLEHHARRRAVELAAAYRLIPRIIDREGIEAARVEAKLRRAVN
jgi:hypothetical protein